MSKTFYLEMLDGGIDGIFVHDLKKNGRLIHVNQKALEMYGYEKNEALGLNLEHFHSGKPPYTQEEARKKYFKAAKGEPQLFEWQAKTKSGELLWIEVVMKRSRFKEFDYLLSFVKDITERKKIEKQTQQLQKLKSIGQLAGGVAHDLNNLLTPMLGYTEMLLEDKTISDLSRKRLSAILKAGNSAKDLVTQLLAFSRKQALKFRQVNINDVITDFEPLIRRSIQENIELRIKTTRGLSQIKADISQMEQVILNLSVNAADAMPRGGCLTIETRMTELDQSYASAKPGVTPGHYIQLSFSDTGVGMGEKTIEKIFEPFFSTKEEKGTGLGLATVYGIIKQHKGNIWVYSEPGQGTTFKIYLPVCQSKAPVKKETQPKISDLNGTETILLAEDNDEARNIAKEILEKRGYNVLTASNGRQAIETWASYQGEIHLLLTDVVMPKANGKEVFLVIKELDPQIKVLYMSGYTDNVLSRQGGLDEGVHFIQKPFRHMDLLTKVRQALTD
jgi:PAS domain S-box-containing protein